VKERTKNGVEWVDFQVTRALYGREIIQDKIEQTNRRKWNDLVTREHQRGSEKSKK